MNQNFPKQSAGSKIFASIIIFWLLIVVLFTFIFNDKNIPPKIIEKVESEFVDIYILEDENNKYLSFKKIGEKSSDITKFDNIQSAINKKDKDKVVLDYVNILTFSPALLPKFEDALIIGLGGGTLTRFFNNKFPELNIDAVDINKHVVALAKNIFYLNENDKLKITIADGRKFMRNSEKKYDLIVIDAYSNIKSIPLHLITDEFLKILNQHLKKSGVVAFNIISLKGQNDEYISRFISTIKNNFNNIIAYKTSEERNNNNLVFANNSKKKFNQKILEENFQKLNKDKNYNSKKLPQDYFIFDVKNIKKSDIYTDDNAYIK